AMEVGVPALAVARDVPAATGVLVAALSLGGVAGAAAYGARRWRAAAETRLVVLMLALGVVLAPLVLIGPLPAFWAMLCCAGMLLNPPLTTASLLVDEYAPGARAEAFGWLSTAITVGGAAGSALAGVVGERWFTTAPFLAAAGFALLGGGVAAILVRRGRP
ncbi:MAG TPA: hypothetical protein VFV66_18595, partial [Nonomuraea sp.]|nr:hypothetical protein [Nonomuraea sp.]